MQFCKRLFFSFDVLFLFFMSCGLNKFLKKCHGEWRRGEREREGERGEEEGREERRRDVLGGFKFLI